MQTFGYTGYRGAEAIYGACRRHERRDCGTRRWRQREARWPGARYHPVVPGEVLVVFVGGAPQSTSGGFNGGGNAAIAGSLDGRGAAARRTCVKGETVCRIV